MKQSTYIASESDTFIDKIKEVPPGFTLFVILFFVFLLLPLTSLAAVI